MQVRGGQVHDEAVLPRAGENMLKTDLMVKLTLLVIALFLGMIALHPLYDPPLSVQAKSARFDHVFILSTLFMYKGQQGLLVMDKRNGNVWLIPKENQKGFRDPIFLLRLPFEKLDETPPPAVQ
jgi:hypothetical protein